MNVSSIPRFADIDYIQIKTPQSKHQKGGNLKIRRIYEISFGLDNQKI